MFWYSLMVAQEDVQTQRNGIISVIFAIGDSIRRPLEGGIFLHLSKFLKTVPYLLRGFHFCYEDEFIAHVYPNPIKIVQLAVDTLTRTKLRIHHGKPRFFFLFLDLLIFPLMCAFLFLFENSTKYKLNFKK